MDKDSQKASLPINMQNIAFAKVLRNPEKHLIPGS